MLDRIEPCVPELFTAFFSQPQEVKKQEKISIEESANKKPAKRQKTREFALFQLARSADEKKQDVHATIRP